MDGSGRSEASVEIARGASRRAERMRLEGVARRFGPEARGAAVALAALVDARRTWRALPSLLDLALGEVTLARASRAVEAEAGIPLPGAKHVRGVDVRGLASALAKAIDWERETDPAGRVLQELRAAGDRKRHGAFYTPTDVVAQTLDAAGIERGQRVLDPACGSGAFLVEAARRGAHASGADLDAEAVEVARFRVACAGGEGELAAGSALDSLPPRAWDAVIGNPPYVRFHEMDETLRGSLAARFETCVGQFDLFAPFLELALDVVRPGGAVAFVLPALLLRGARYAHLRKALLDRARVEHVIDHGDGAFEGVLAPTCILVLRKGSGPAGRRLAPAGVHPRAAREKTSDAVSRTVRWVRPGGERVEVEERVWWEDPEHAFAPIDAEDARLLAALARHPRLDDVARLGRGVEIGKHHPALGAKGVPCVTGSDLRSGEARPAKRLDLAKLGPRLAPGESDLSARVLVRETGARLTAACVEKGVASTRSVFHVIPHALPREFVLAWILSSHAQRWFELCVRAESGIFPKLRIGQLGSLRIPCDEALVAKVLALGGDETAVDAAFAERLR